MTRIHQTIYAINAIMTRQIVVPKKATQVTLFALAIPKNSAAQDKLTEKTQLFAHTLATLIENAALKMTGN